jgi:hypothetical protein
MLILFHSFFFGVEMDNFMKIPTKKNCKEKFFIYFHDEMENYGNLITFEIIMFFVWVLFWEVSDSHHDRILGNNGR